MEVAENVAHLDLVELSADLVAAYVGNNSVSPAALPTLLVQVHDAFARLAGSTLEVVQSEPETPRPTPAQIRKSITPDALISFIDGKRYKTLKRHLSTHGLDAASYRERYGLPSDYPMVAASYAATRSALAKSLGLGNVRKREPVPGPEPAPAPVAAEKSRRSPRKRKAAESA